MKLQNILSIGAVLFCTAAGAEEYARAGLLKNGSVWEVGIAFESNVNLNTAIHLESYSIPGASVDGLRLFRKERAVVLTVGGLAAGNQYSLNMTNIWDNAGEKLPVLGLSVEAKNLSWTSIGSNELGIAPDAMAVGEGGFNLISAGAELWGRYDEATFVYEQITGDFDKRVRVEFQDPSSEAARAGLMVRESLDAGKPRPQDPFDPAQAFSKYVEVHATPATTVYETEAANTHQVNVRYYLGGIDHPTFQGTENPSLENNAAPAYPDAWLRMTRTGQTFEAFRSTDGTNWVRLGTFTYGVNGIPPFGNTAFVGPSFCPENANIPFQTGQRFQPFVARFRDYSVSEGAGVVLSLSISRVDDQVEVSWDGDAVLQSNATADSSGWSDLSAAVSPYFTSPAEKTFYRLRARN